MSNTSDSHQTLIQCSFLQAPLFQAVSEAPSLSLPARDLSSSCTPFRNPPLASALNAPGPSTCRSNHLPSYLSLLARYSLSEELVIFLLRVCAFTMQSLDALFCSDCGADCEQKCWVNSKFVSTCSNSTQCLCDDVDFQSVSFDASIRVLQTSHLAAV